MPDFEPSGIAWSTYFLYFLVFFIAIILLPTLLDHLPTSSQPLNRRLPIRIQFTEWDSKAKPIPILCDDKFTHFYGRRLPIEMWSEMELKALLWEKVVKLDRRNWGPGVTVEMLVDLKYNEFAYAFPSTQVRDLQNRILHLNRHPPKHDAVGLAWIKTTNLMENEFLTLIDFLEKNRGLKKKGSKPMLAWCDAIGKAGFHEFNWPVDSREEIVLRQRLVDIRFEQLRRTVPLHFGVDEIPACYYIPRYIGNLSMYWVMPPT